MRSEPINLTNVNENKSNPQPYAEALNSSSLNCSFDTQPYSNYNNPYSYEIKGMYDNYFNNNEISFNRVEQINDLKSFLFTRSNAAHLDRSPIDRFNERLMNQQVNGSSSNFNNPIALESEFSCLHSEIECRNLLDQARKGEVQMIKRRLTEIEKKSIRPGSIFIYSESGSGIKRWTDSKAWTPSRVLGPFLTYKELEGDLFKKTFTVKHTDAVFHIVSYSLNEWERNGKCCKILGKVKKKENFNANSHGSANGNVSKLYLKDNEKSDGIIRGLEAGY